MPRTKKPAGQAVDRRNGRQLELAATRLEFFPLPARRPAWLASTREAWAIAWADPVCVFWTPADGPILLRWADAVDRAVRSVRRADRNPVVLGSTKQLTEHPSFGTWKAAVSVAQVCEQQLGMGALNRSKLGVELGAARESLAKLMADFAGEVEHEPDPRLG